MGHGESAVVASTGATELVRLRNKVSLTSTTCTGLAALTSKPAVRLCVDSIDPGGLQGPPGGDPPAPNSPGICGTRPAK